MPQEVYDFIRASWWDQRGAHGLFPYWLISWLVLVNSFLLVNCFRISRALNRLRYLEAVSLPPRLALLVGTSFWSSGISFAGAGIVPFIWPNYVVIASWHCLTACVLYVTANATIVWVDEAAERPFGLSLACVMPAQRRFSEQAEKIKKRAKALSAVRQKLLEHIA